MAVTVFTLTAVVNIRSRFAAVRISLDTSGLIRVMMPPRVNTMDALAIKR